MPLEVVLPSGALLSVSIVSLALLGLLLHRLLRARGRRASASLEIECAALAARMQRPDPGDGRPMR